MICAPVPKWIMGPDFGSGVRRFDSCRGYQFSETRLLMSTVDEEPFKLEMPVRLWQEAPKEGTRHGEQENVSSVRGFGYRGTGHHKRRVGRSVRTENDHDLSRMPWEKGRSQRRIGPMRNIIAVAIVVAWGLVMLAGLYPAGAAIPLGLNADSVAPWYLVGWLICVAVGSISLGYAAYVSEDRLTRDRFGDVLVGMVLGALAGLLVGIIWTVIAWLSISGGIAAKAAVPLARRVAGHGKPNDTSLW